jgi:hypothetical protein
MPCKPAHHTFSHSDERESQNQLPCGVQVFFTNGEALMAGVGALNCYLTLGLQERKTDRAPREVLTVNSKASFSCGNKMARGKV